MIAALCILLAASQPIPGEISITSTSPEAVKLYLAGRDKALNFANEEAAELFRKALALDEKFALALAMLGKVTPGEAGLAQVQRAAGLAAGLPETERLSIDVILAERKGEDERARNLKRQIADLAPQDWLAQYQLGVQDSYDHKSQATILHLNKAIKLNPKAAEAYNYLGYTLAQQGQTEEGIAAVRKFVDLKPNESNSWDSFGEVLLLAGKYDEAEAAFRKATVISPSDWMSWIGVAYARFFRGDFAGGRQAANGSKKWITRAPDKLAVDLVLAWSQLAEGNADEALREVDAIEKDAQARKADFQLAWAAVERAEMLAELGRNEEAAKQVALAATRGQKGRMTGAESNRVRRSTLVLMARLAAARGDHAAGRKAVGELEAELRAAPSNADLRGDVHYARGMVELGQGDAAAAIADLARCPETAYLCRLELSVAQERAGDKGRAEETRRQLLHSNVRDNVHHGDDPTFLYLAAREKRAAK